MEIKIGNTKYNIKLKDNTKGLMGINKHKGYFKNSTQETQQENEIILYGEQIGSQTFWHEIVHTIFAELAEDSKLNRLALKIYPNEYMIDKIATMIYETNNQLNITKENK